MNSNQFQSIPILFGKKSGLTVFGCAGWQIIALRLVPPGAGHNRRPLKGGSEPNRGKVHQGSSRFIKANQG
jgi:hypothetical protein